MIDKLRPWVQKIYGPYTRRDGRQHVILCNGQKKRTVSYPKWLMEQHIGRELTENETVDHINRDFTDNRIENLQVISRSKHASLDAKRVNKVEVECVGCSRKLVRSPRNLNHNAKQGKAGPFCKSCAGKYGTDIQNGKEKRKKAQPEIPIDKRDYYFKDK